MRELFRFAPDFGSPFLHRISTNELLVVQPPPRAGERQLGVFIDGHGNVAPRSTIHWRHPPLGCMARGRALVTMLPNSVEVDHPDLEPTHQTIPFAGARCSASGGELLLVANTDAVWALLPPRRRDVAADDEGAVDAE